MDKSDKCSNLIALGPLVLERDASMDNTQQSKSTNRCLDDYHLLFNQGVPRLIPGSGHRTLNTGEAILLDDSMFSRFAIDQSTGLMHWVLPAQWLHDTVAAPSHMLGQPMRAPCKWSVALNAFLDQLSADVIRSGPVSPAMLAVQIGTLLALIAESDQQEKPQTQPPSDLLDRAKSRIAEQCCDAEIKAVDVAQSLGVSPRTLHRTLASHGETFGNLLMTSRIQLSERMLSSPNFRRLPVSEIGKRAGFKDPSHFAKVFRRMRGMSPTEAQRMSDSL